MTYSNQDLLQRLQAIRLGETDTAKRDADIKMLCHLCEDDYHLENNSTNIKQFLRKANDPQGNFTKFAHDIVDSANANVLRDTARQKFKLLMIENRINRIRSDSSAKKEDVSFLNGLIAQDQERDQDQNSLSQLARDKIERIRASQMAKQREYEEIVQSTLDDLNALRGLDLINGAQPETREREKEREKERESVADLITRIQRPTGDSIDKILNDAEADIEVKIKKNKKAQDEYTTLGHMSASTAKFLGWDTIKPKSRRERLTELKETQKDLEEAKKRVQSARRQIQFLSKRLKVQQAELLELYDKLSPRDFLQRAIVEHQIGEEFPRDEAIKPGHIYFQRERDGIYKRERDRIYKVKLRFSPQSPVIEKKYSLEDVNKKVNDKAKTKPQKTLSNAIRELLIEDNLITQDPFCIDRDLASLKTTRLRVENIKKDMQETRRLLALCEQMANNPTELPPKELSRPANHLMRVMALSERQRYDEQGKRYFVEEIISIDPDAPAIEQPRGLSGYTLYRRVHLGKNEIKRTTCETNKGKIVIETSVRKNERGQDIAMVVDRTANSQHLEEDDKKRAALQYAAELLAQHKPGDKIVLEGGPEHAKQAEYVYAALLMLTMPDPSNPNDETPPLDPSCITVNVRGANIPGLRSKAYYAFGDWRQAFIQQTFQGVLPDKISEMKTEITKVRQRSITEGIQPTLEEDIQIEKRRGP